MKTTFFSLFLLCILFISCEKDNPIVTEDDHLIVGVGFLTPLTEWSINPTDVQIDISGDLHSFNKSEAAYVSGIPYYNQNVLLIHLTDTVTNEHISFEIFTPIIESEDFFKEATFKIDSVNIDWLTTMEGFYNADATFKWVSVVFENGKFKGDATLEITKRLDGTLNSDSYYPEQKIGLRFE